MLTSSKKEEPQSNSWIPYTYYWNTFPGKWPFVEPHFHPQFEINYMAGGAMSFSLNDETFLGKEGDIILIQPNTIHSITRPKDATGLNSYHTFIFNSDFLCGALGEFCYTEILKPIVHGQTNISCAITKSHPYYNEIRTALENILSATNRRDPLLTLMIKGELLHLFYYVLEYKYYEKTTVSNQSIQDLQQVLVYINKHFDQKITLDQLSKIAHLSPGRFTIKFKQIMGISAVTYINQVRLKKACQLLTDTTESVLNIATLCGFNNISHFNVQFKRNVGIAPYQYRKRFSGMKNNIEN